MSEPLAPPFLAYQSPPLRQPKPRVWLVYLLPFLLIFLLYYPVGYATGYLAFRFWSAGATPLEHYDNCLALLRSIPFRLGYSATVKALELLILLALALFSRVPITRRFALRRPHCSLLYILICALGGVALATLLGFARWTLHAPSRSLDTLNQIVAGSTPSQTVACFALMAIMGPILEELLFRGYIQTRLTQRHGPLLAILITSLLFGIFHLDLTQGTLAFFYGLLQGAIAYRTASILPAIACHIAVNAAFVIEVALHLSITQFGPSFAIASIIILPAALWLIFHTKPSPSAYDPPPAIV